MKAGTKATKTRTERVADLECKLRTARTAAKQLELRVSVLEEWAGELVDGLNAWAIGFAKELDEQKGRCENLHRLLDVYLPEGAPERAIIRTGLQALIERGGADPVDGNAVNIFRRVLPTQR